MENDPMELNGSHSALELSPAPPPSPQLLQPQPQPQSIIATDKICNNTSVIENKLVTNNTNTNYIDSIQPESPSSHPPSPAMPPTIQNGDCEPEVPEILHHNSIILSEQSLQKPAELLFDPTLILTPPQSAEVATDLSLPNSHHQDGTIVELQEAVDLQEVPQQQQNHNNIVSLLQPPRTLLPPPALLRLPLPVPPPQSAPAVKQIEALPPSSQQDNHENTRISVKRKAEDDRTLFNNMHRDKIFKSNNKKKYYPFNLLPDADLPQDLFNDGGNEIPTNNLTPALVPNVMVPPPPPPPPPPVPLALPPNMHHLHTHSLNGGGYNEEIRNFLRDQIKFWGGGRLNELGGLLTNEYAQYLGLQPAVKFKCFKCGESQFASLFELKEHQESCLRRKNHVPPKSTDFLSTTTIMTPPPPTSMSASATTTTTASHQTASSANNTNNHLNSKNSVNNSSCNNNNNNSHNNNKSGSCDPSTKIRITRKVFLCSACGTYYENWNLFLHMREVHKRHICLYCLGLFPSSERLLQHLTHKHNITEQKYDTREHLVQSFKSPCYLMCSNCEHVFNEIDNFSNHLCENFMEPCTECGLKSVHKPNCSIATAVTKTMTKNKKERDKSKKKVANVEAVGGGGLGLPNGHAMTVNGGSPSMLPPLPPPNNNSNARVNDSKYSLSPVAPPQPASLFNPPASQQTLPENEQINNEVPGNPSVDHDVHNDAAKDDDEDDTHENDEDDDGNTSTSDDSESSESSSDAADENSIRGGYAQIVSSSVVPPPSSQEPGTPLLVPKLKIKFNQNSFQSSFVPKPAPDLVPPDDKEEGDDDEEEEQDEEEEEQDEEEVEDEEVEEQDEENDNVGEVASGEDEENDVANDEAMEKHDTIVKPDATEDEILDEEQADDDEELAEVEQTNMADVSAEDKTTEMNPNEIPATVEDPTAIEDNPKEELSNEESVLEDVKDSLEFKFENNEQPELSKSDDDHNSTIKSETKVDEESFENVMDMSIDSEIGLGELAKDEIKDQPKDESLDLVENKYINEADLIKSIEEPEILDVSSGNNILLANDDALSFELTLQHPLDKIEIHDFLKICLQAAVPFCSYCNHARRIAVNGKALAMHLISQHRYSAIVDSITAEELLPSTIVGKILSCLTDLEESCFNLDSYDNTDKTIVPQTEKLFECFQCRFVTNVHKELYLHNRKMHLKSILLCIMCKSNFYSYSELICHLCPGVYNKVMILDLTFRCCICNLDNIPSAFRLMVHIRKKHNACDVCLEECFDQSRLSNHVWKHKLHHLCYRCGIAYRNKPDITKHLFWKHGTESVLCKRCLQKKWPHVYHFCIPPPMFVCEDCDMDFERAVALKVHKRLHSGDAKYPCTEDECEKKFISRKLLLKHVERHSMVIEEIPIEDMHIKSEVEEADEEESADVKEEKDSESVKSEESSKEEVEEKVKEKSKKKKSSKNKKNELPNVIPDIIDLPALNLSESDSSDEDDSNQPQSSEHFSNTMPVNMDIDNELDDDDVKIAPVVDIWNNFKEFQEKQMKTKDDGRDEVEIEVIPTPILHVVQSDHDYAMMYRSLKVVEANSEEMELEPESAAIKSSSPKKRPSKISDSSSSSGSSSGSDSCSCGTDCSCSSSSSGDSSSSSSDEEENTTAAKSPEKRKKGAKKENKKQQQETPQKVDVEQQKSQTETIDVVNTTDAKIAQIADPDLLILDSDLDTDESETDEDFYDEHPQKLATQLLAEKRNQLMMRTSLNPMNNAVVENSRPSTPSLPEEVVKEKRVKLKKKKKERRKAPSPFKLSIVTPAMPSPQVAPVQEERMDVLRSTDILSHHNESFPFESTSMMSPAPPPQQMRPMYPPSTPQDLKLTIPMSTSTPTNSSYLTEMSDSAIKRSKRRRIPNRFYGYSSDEESPHHHSHNLLNPLFKPTPPPILTWRKEDLPSPSSSQPTPKLKIKSPALPKIPKYSKQNSRNTSPVPQSQHYHHPPIPPMIIRPSSIMPQPPKVEPLRVPAVPVHHITPLVIQNTTEKKESSDSSDSESSNEGHLQILTPNVLHPLKTKIFLNKSSSHTAPRRQRPRPRPMVAAPQILTPCIDQPTPPLQLLQQQQLLATPPPVATNSSAQPFVRPPPQINPITGLPCYPPAGTRVPKEGESVYCYCQCPYDEVSEMIACDGDDCRIEWFHFECVGIMVPPKGKWYCPDCKPKYLSRINNTFDDDDDNLG